MNFDNELLERKTNYRCPKCQGPTREKIGLFMKIINRCDNCEKDWHRYDGVLI